MRCTTGAHKRHTAETSESISVKGSKLSKRDFFRLSNSKFFITGIAAAALSQIAMADSTTSSSWIPYTNYGYVGLNVGGTDYKGGNCISGYECDDSDIGVSVYTGGQFSRVIGIELGYVNVGKFDRDGGNKKAQGVDLRLVGNLPLGEKADLYAKAGGIYGWTKTTSSVPGFDDGSEKEFNWAYGAGLQFHIDPRWAVHLDWDQYRMKFSDRRDNVAMYSAGVTRKF